MTGTQAGKLLDGTGFVCESAEQCADLRRKLAAGAQVTVELRFSPEAAAPLTVVRAG